MLSLYFSIVNFVVVVVCVSTKRKMHLQLSWHLPICHFDHFLLFLLLLLLATAVVLL